MLIPRQLLNEFESTKLHRSKDAHWNVGAMKFISASSARKPFPNVFSKFSALRQAVCRQSEQTEDEVDATGKDPSCSGTTSYKW